MAADEGEKLPNTGLYTLGAGVTLWRATINAFLEAFDANAPHTHVNFERPQPGQEPDGARKTFDTANSFIQNSSMVFLNGTQMEPGSGNEYQEGQSGTPAGEYNQIIVEAGEDAPESGAQLHWAYARIIP